jgi:hypothetical protein
LGSVKERNVNVNDKYTNKLTIEPLHYSEEERQEILTPYQGILKKIRASSLYRQDPEENEEVLSFITGTSQVVPQNFEWGKLIYSHDLFLLFQPHYKEWTFIETRLITMIALREGRPKVNGGFMGHIKKMILDDQPGVLEYIIPILKEAGVSREMVRDFMCRQSFYDNVNYGYTDILWLDKEISMAGEFLLSYYDEQGWEGMLDLKEVKYHNYEERKIYLNLFRFFAHTRTDDFEKRFDPLLINHQVYPDESIIHAPYQEWKILMALDKDRFHPRFSLLFTQINCPYCKYRLARIGNKYFPDFYEEALFSLSEELLEEISLKRNKDHNYGFHCILYLSEEAQKINSGYIYDRQNLDKSDDLIRWISEVYGQKAAPMLLNHIYTTSVFKPKLVALCVEKLGQEMEPMVLHGLEREATEENAADFKILFSALKNIKFSAPCEKRLWTLLSCGIESIRDGAARAMAGKDLLTPEKMDEGLKSKDKNQRDGMIRLLCFEGSDETLSPLRNLLLSERNEPIRDVILKNWDFQWDLDMTGVKALIQRVETNKKLNCPVKAWLDVSSLPRLSWINGEELRDSEMMYLFYRQNRETQLTLEPELKSVIKQIDRSKSGEFAYALFELLMENGGPTAKNRFALTLVGVLGNDRLAAPLEEYTIKNKNEVCPTVLMLLGTNKALRTLNRIIRYFNVKYPNVKKAAQSAFRKAAKERNISSYELSDSIISTFGFDGLTREVMIDDKAYTLRISDKLKLTYRDEEKGKTFKTLPKAASLELKEEMKVLSKDIRENTKEVLKHLEHYLVIQRKWKRPDWEKFFLNHPLLFALTPLFIWGVYQEGTVTTTFRYNGEGEFLKTDGDDFTLPEGEIGLVHPIEMKEEAITLWKEQLTDYEISQPFLQLEREIHFLEEDEGEFTFCSRFDSKEVEDQTFKYRAGRRGWRRGVTDDGIVENYLKRFDKAGIDGLIELVDLNVHSMGESVTLRELHFMTTESKSQHIELKDVPPAIFSEVIGDMRFITR